MRPGVTTDELGLDIEKQQQVEKLLQRVERLVGIVSGEASLPQPVQVALERRVVAAIRADLQRVRGERKAIRAMLLEPVEVREPRVDAARREKRFAKRLVGGNIAGCARKNLRERRDRGVGLPLLIEDHAKVEIGGMQIGPERKRPLIGAGCLRQVLLHLQRDALVVVRFAVRGVAPQCFGERGERRRRTAPFQLGLSQDAPERSRVRGQRKPVAGDPGRFGDIAALEHQRGEGDARIREIRSCGNRRSESWKAHRRGSFDRAPGPPADNAPAHIPAAVREPMRIPTWRRPSLRPGAT